MCDLWSEGNAAVAWEAVGSRELHWFHVAHHAWLSRPNEGSSEAAACSWAGWSAETAHPHALHTEWVPWAALCLEGRGSPVVRWFHGGLTNAAFNELDRHVLAAHGDGVALVGVAPGGSAHEAVALHALLENSVVMAHALVSELGLAPHTARVALYLPNDARAVTCIEAAKRVGATYAAVASGTSSHALSGRLLDTGAALLLSSLELARAAQEARELMVADRMAGVPPAGVLLPPTAMYATSDAVVDGEIGGGWRLATGALQRSRARLLELSDGDGGRLALLSPAAPHEAAPHVATLWLLARPRPVDSNFPLFILHTSGSTGKPKGIVHTHGGYEVGLCLTSRVVFALRPLADALLVIATPGWITGQSYMIGAALLCRVPSVLLEGSPVSPPDHFAATIERCGILFESSLPACASLRYS
jgi:acyl-CoA synthetase (AMP-forming)/AMP-acid ligase II